MIGQVGTFDIENYGDLLYPVIFQSMMRSRGWVDEVEKVSFLDGEAPGQAGYYTKKIQDVLDESKNRVRNLVVGGGDILRTDKEMLASHYEKQYQTRKEKNYLYKLRRKLFGNPSLTNEFVRRYMNYDAVGPFIIDAGKFDSVDSVAFCSCGVPFRFEEYESAAISEAFDSAKFIYLRDEQSKEKLRAAGVKSNIQVAPDLLVTLSDFFDYKKEKGKGSGILSKNGVDIAKKVLCFQCPPTSFIMLSEIAKKLCEYRENNNAEVVLMPVGYYHGDHYAMKKISEISNGKLKYIGVYSIYEMLSLIAASDVFVGTSMHGNITAFSYGIPHLFAPISVDKLDGFLGQVGLDYRSKILSYDEMGERIHAIESLGRDHIFEKVRVAKNKVHNMFDSLYSVLS
jgi:exopolysaccharide biosynthesis predicted pyruvyltransferase EpsI